LYFCLGNLYGFSSPADHVVNAAVAEFYLRKVIRLKPPDQERTVGYAHFCLGTLKGLLALGFLENKSGPSPGKSLAEAVMELEEAEKCHHIPAHQYHLKGYLLFHAERFEEAAEAWGRAAELYWPPSGKMYLNCGCALDDGAEIRESCNRAGTRGFGFRQAPKFGYL
jgi:hypothetical protein